MDSDAVVGILMVLFWVFTSLVARFKRKSHSELPENQAPADGTARGELVEKALRELAEQMGVEVEVSPAEAPTASEHAPTASEHRRTRSETFGTPSEHRTGASEHRQTATEVRRTASESVLPAGEHDWTSSEHRRGDVQIERPPASVPRRRRQRSRFAQRLTEDLTGGRTSLARAIALREILGPPVSMRSPEQDRA